MLPTDYHTVYATPVSSEQDDALLPELSIIVPVFNTAPYIEQCLQSLYAQQGVNLEIILINDGSTDNSLELAIRFAKSHTEHKFLVIDQLNQGLSAVRNLGIKLATGEYIAFFDSDDFTSPDTYLHMLNLGRTHNCDIVFSRSIVHDHQTKINACFYDEWIWDRILDGRPEVVTSALRHPQLFMLEPGSPFRISKLSFVRAANLYYPVGKCFEDPPSHLLGILTAHRIGLCNIRGYFYRIGRTGTITSSRSEKRFDVLTSMDLSLSQILPHQPDYVQGAYITLALLRIVDWCGSMTHFSDRFRFYEMASARFSTLPLHWIKRFETEFIIRLNRQVSMLAMYYKDVDLLVTLSSGYTPVLKVVSFLLKHRRYRTLWNHKTELFKKLRSQ